MSDRKAEDNLLFRLASWIVGSLLIQMAKYAHRIGDHHEFCHILLAVEAGNTEKCQPDCSVIQRVWLMQKIKEGQPK